MVMYDLLSILCSKSQLLFRHLSSSLRLISYQSSQNNNIPGSSSNVIIIQKSTTISYWYNPISPIIRNDEKTENKPKQMVNSFWCFTCTCITAKEEKNIFGSCALCFPFVISQAERRTRGLLGSLGSAFSLVCLWGDYNLNAASLEAFSHSSFPVVRKVGKLCIASI